TFLLLYLQRLGMRKMEAFIITLVGIIAIAFLIQIWMAKPAISEIATGFIPKIQSKEALYIAIGIIGATVMPHNLYLHSSLVQTRKFDRTPGGIKQAIKFNRVDSAIALNMAFLVNTAILVVAGTVFFKTGNSQVAEIHEAYRLLPSFLGNFAPILFAVALIAAGQSSTITGTLAGQIVMEGYLNLRINPWLRRLITRSLAIIPAVLVILLMGPEKVDALLVLSQVILSLQLGFAIVPLIHFVSDREKMGKFTINLPTKILSWLIAGVLLWLNIQMLAGQSEEVFMGPSLWPKLAVGSLGILFTGLLLYLVAEPTLRRRRIAASFKIHPEMENLSLDIPKYNIIAIALDFTENDGKLISYAVGQGHKGSKFVLLHIVESASANLWGNQSADYETRKDHDQLSGYVEQLKKIGYQATSMLGFRNRSREIVRLVTESKADLLVVGAHGHTGIKDLIYGETVNTVRHELTIPILMVSIKEPS
ncbi:MAG: Nramp family divalent metal transporter, partial [Bacteroidota bacterium]|nr:Nramp family divalent metal transporter [Bacteroidota bacterium]